MTRTRLGIMTILASSVFIACMLFVTRGVAQNATGRDPSSVRATSVRDGFTLAAVGDLLVQKPIRETSDPEFTGMVKILREASVTMANMETSIIDMRNFHGYATGQGIAMTAPPEVAKELKSLGFDIVSNANNHAANWGTEGLIETNRHLDEAGLIHAGTGLSRSEARAPRYFTTETGVRVALVSFASSFPMIARSSDPINGTPGVPGLSALRTRRFNVVSPKMMQDLRAIASAYKQAGVSTAAEFQIGALGGTDTTYATKDDELELFGTYYREGDKPGLEYEMNPIDEQQILAAIRDGKAQSDFLIATIHAHESPADFVQKIAREAIDNGADAFVGHGPHRLLGIEIYKGRPIFYGLSNFFNQTALKEPVTLDEYERWGEDSATVSPAEFSLRWSNRAFSSHEVFQAVIAVSKYEHGSLAEVRLQPVDLDFDARPADRGTPRLAGPAAAREILERIQKLSEPYGTRLTIEDGVGVIALRGNGTTRQ